MEVRELKRKTLLSLFIIIMLIMLSSAILVGCDKDEPEVSQYTPGDAFAEVARRIMESDEMQVGKQMSVDIVLDISMKNHRNNKETVLEIFMRGNANYNDNSTNADNNFILELTNKTDDSKVIGLYADGEYLYVDLINDHYKIENFKLRDILMGKGNQQTRAVDLEAIFRIVGDLLFDSVEVVNDNQFTFQYDLSKTLKTYEEIFVELIGMDSLNEFSQSLGYDNWNHFVDDVIGELKGELVYKFDRNNNLDSQQWHNKGDKNSFSISAPTFSINDSNLIIDFDKYINKDVEWIQTKLMNIKLNGSFNVISDGAKVGVYDWELITNLDPLELLANQGDFNLDDDDMAHFIVRARMNESTQEYNDSKVKAANGVVLELAYSPREFKNNNLMLTFNPKAILSKALVKELGIPEIAMGFLPEYYGTHIDVDVLREMGNVGKVEQKSGVNKGLSIGDLLGAIQINSDGLTLDVSIFSALPGDIGNILSSLFAVGDKTADKINITVDYSKFGDRTNGGYNVKDHFLYIADEENNQFKDFSGTTGFIPAKESKPINNDGFVELTTSSGKKINMVDNAHKLSVEELPTLIGGKIKYNYIDFDGNNQTAVTPVTILGISNVDSNIIGEVQSVNLITSIPDGKNLLSLIGALKIIPDIPGNVYTTKIILSSEKSADMTYAKELNYRVGDELIETDILGQLTITYDDDSNYVYNNSAITHNIITTKIGTKSIVSQPGKYTISYNIGGRYLERAIEVVAAERVEININNKIIGKQGESIDKNYGKVRVHYDSDNFVEYDIDQSMIEFPSGAIADGKFKVSGEYYIKINCFGKSERVLVIVEPRVLVLPTGKQI